MIKGRNFIDFFIGVVFNICVSDFTFIEKVLYQIFISIESFILNYKFGVFWKVVPSCHHWINDLLFEQYT